MTKNEILKRSPSPGFMYEIEGKEISLVGHPANKREFLLTKSVGDNKMDELLQLIQEAEAENESQLVKSLEEEGVSEEGIRVAKAIARLRDGYADELENEEIAKALGFESDEDSEDDEPIVKGADINKSDLEGLDSETREKLTGALEKMRTLEQAVDEIDRDRRREGWLSKAQELDAISADADEVADELIELEDTLGTEKAESHLERLRSANEVAKESDAFEETGSSGSGGSSASSAYEEVLQKADELVSDNPDLEKHEAIDRVMQTDEELRKRYAQETS